MPSIALPVSLRGQLLSGIRAPVAAFSPIDLFATGSQGIWLDPSDLSTMFSDRAGTTPVTTPGTVVGLRLDKSKGLTLGAELVTNGDFSTDTDWTKGTGWTISGGEAVFTPGTGSVLSQNLSGLSTTKSYIVSFSLVTTASTITLRFGSSGVNTFSGLTTGNYSYRIPPGGTVGIYFVANGATACTIDNISVRELAGNHAVAPTDAARPIYGVEPKGGRRNLLTYSEDLTNAIWTKTAASISGNVDTAPDGTISADRLVEDGTSGAHFTQATFAVVSGQSYTLTVYAKASGRNWLRVAGQATLFSTPNHAWFDLQNGQMGTTESGTTASITSVGDGWYRCSWTRATISSGSAGFFICAQTANGETTYAGNGTSGILLWGAQLETGSTASAYQRVLSAYDITESGVATCHYVQYDGSDDSMSTAAINFTATDKMSVFAGVRKLSDAATAMIVESSTDSGATNGSFRLLIPAAAGYEYRQRGTINAPGAAVSSGYASPISNIITGLGDISGDLLKLRINGIQVAQSTADQGSSAFGNYPLFFGRRNNASNSFNGKDYGIVVVGKAASAGEITDTETWLAAKTAQVTL